MKNFVTKPVTVQAVQYRESTSKSLPWRIIEYGLCDGGVSGAHFYFPQGTRRGECDAWVAEGEWIVEYPDGTVEVVEDDDTFNERFAPA